MIVNLEGKPLAIKEKKMKAKKAFLIFALLFLMVGMVGTLGVSAKKETLKIDVCHATSSATNPYVLVNVSINSVETAQNVGGHGSHAEDAWEPYTYDGVDYPGQGDMSNCDDLPIDILGCMDPLALNYDPLATIDDGSCEYPPEDILGCMDPLALNYDPLATIDDGSCEYPPEDILGCMDPLALNYDPLATIDDGSCEYPPEDILGCMDPLALNYDPLATIDDGSCEYPEKPEKPAGSPPAGAGELELFGAMQLLGYGGFLTMLSLAAWPRSKNN